MSMHHKNVNLFAGHVDAAADDANMASYAGTEESRTVVSDSSTLPCQKAPSAFCFWQSTLVFSVA